MFIYFIVIAITVVISAIFANIWVNVSQSATFGATINSFPIMNNILTRLPVLMAVIGFVGIVVMFAKPYISNEYE